MHHKRFFTFHNKKRPYIILKWAETKDGFIAPSSKNEQKPVWITNTYSRQLVHKWRAEEQAILVGTNTVLEDNPSLTVRDWTGKNPIRVVLDKRLKLGASLSVFGEESDTIIIGDNNDIFPEIDENQKGWSINPPSGRGISATYIKIDWEKSAHIAKQICGSLIRLGINSIIIEGGSKTLQTFIDEELWDEARVFKGNVELKTGVKGPKLKGKLISESYIKKDLLRIYAKN